MKTLAVLFALLFVGLLPAQAEMSLEELEGTLPRIDSGGVACKTQEQFEQLIGTESDMRSVEEMLTELNSGPEGTVCTEGWSMYYVTEPPVKEFSSSDGIEFVIFKIVVVAVEANTFDGFLFLDLPEERYRTMEKLLYLGLFAIYKESKAHQPLAEQSDQDLEYPKR